MTACIIISSITAVLLVLTIIFKPYVKIGRFGLGLYWVVALVGAIALLLFKTVSLKEVLDCFLVKNGVNPLKILILFISMTSISVFLGDAGFFDLVAKFIFEKCKLNQKQLFFILYFTVAVLTIFTSNDIIILTLTPPVCIFAKKAKISPLPFLFGEFIAANTFSLALVIGNPTNIYLAESHGITFISYLLTMFIPALVSGTVSAFVIYLLFRKSLSVKISSETPLDSQPYEHHGKNIERLEKTPLIVALVHLIVCIILLTVSDFLKLETYLICLTLAISLIVINLVYRLYTKTGVYKISTSIKKLPFELIPFVLSMFVLVLSLKTNGLTEIFGKHLATNSKMDGIIFGFTSAGCANLLNNIPMSVLFAEIVPSGNLYALYGAIIGSNIGAFITPVGALAGIMWNKILKSYQVDLPFSKFVLYGTITAIPTLISALLTMLLFV